jgi:tRNA pseudouridine55 synthase
MFGILNLNKHAGCTSRAVVDRLGRHHPTVKFGHAGTLDPLASGVLVVCAGQATKLIEYVQRMPKSYRGKFLLGRWSPSDDIETPIAQLADAPVPCRGQLEQACRAQVGRIGQRPPAYSAVKVRGRRAYQLARRGVDVELPPRPVEIYELSIVRYAYPELTLEIRCGSGTYVRAIGRDLAEAVGSRAVMQSLVRTAIGPYRVEEALPTDPWDPALVGRSWRDPLEAVSALGKVRLTPRQFEEVRHGRPLTLTELRTSDPAAQWRGGTAAAQEDPPRAPQWAAVAPDGTLAAILHRREDGRILPYRNFCAA